MKYLFIDFDGTLRTDDKRVTKRTINALKLAEKKGYELVICTGRTKDYAARIRADVGVGRYVIFNNGGGIYDCQKWNVVHTNSINTESIHMLCDLAIKYQNVYLEIQPLLTQVNLQSYNLDTIHLLEGELKDIPLIGVGNRHKALADPEFLKQDLYYYDINAEGVSKGKGVENFCKIFKVDRADTIGIGDGENDIPMLRSCGYGVAMGNAIKQLKEIADFIADTNNNDGVAKFVESLVDKK